MTRGEMIQSRREALGLSRWTLARMADVHPGTIRRWESGESRPRNHHLLRLCRVLGIKPEDLA